MRGNFSALLFVTPFALAAASLLARRRWSFVAGACLIIAPALWLTLGADGAFVAATLGVVAWFWDQRNRLRATVIEAGRDDDDAEDDGEEDDDERDDGYLEETDEADDVSGAGGIEGENETDEHDDSNRRARS